MFDGGFTFWNFLVDAFVIFMFVVWLWLLVSVFSDLFRRSDISGGGKVIWVIFLIVLPYLGVFAYLLTQGGGMSERADAQARKAREEIRGMVGFSAADELKKLDDLKAKGSITDAEYARMRARLV
jgi:hypothetical protein